MTSFVVIDGSIVNSSPIVQVVESGLEGTRFQRLVIDPDGKDGVNVFQAIFCFPQGFVDEHRKTRRSHFRALRNATDER